MCLLDQSAMVGGAVYCPPLRQCPPLTLLQEVCPIENTMWVALEQWKEMRSPTLNVVISVFESQVFYQLAW